MYTVLAPTFSFSQRKRDGGCSPHDDSDEEEEDCDPKYEYQCQLTLPMNCPVKTQVQVGLADKAGFLSGFCKREGQTRVCRILGGEGAWLLISVCFADL